MLFSIVQCYILYDSIVFLEINIIYILELPKHYENPQTPKPRILNIIKVVKEIMYTLYGYKHNS